MTKFSKDKVLLLHQYIASETGGSVGLRDEGLLESALESAFATFEGKELYPTKEEKAARIGASLVANHAFLDAKPPDLLSISPNIGQVGPPSSIKSQSQNISSIAS